MLENQKIPELVKDLGTMYPKKTSAHKRRYGIYKCPYCGKEFKAQRGHIRSKHTQSCGCYQKTQVIKAHTTHGFACHPLYNVWNSMIQRTQDPKCKAYKNYGDRGITVCDRWQKVENFIEDMRPTYEKGLTLDRINNNGNYELSNCRWVTRNIQNRNTRKLRKNNTSGYRGVCWSKREKKWVAQISINSKAIYIGCFNSAKQAAQAYDNYVIEYNLEHTINF